MKIHKLQASRRLQPPLFSLQVKVQPLRSADFKNLLLTVLSRHYSLNVARFHPIIDHEGP